MRGSKVKDIFATISKSIFSKKKKLVWLFGFLCGCSVWGGFSFFFFLLCFVFKGI